MGLEHAMMLGILQSASGACPVCGRDVSRTHLFDGTKLTQRYACHRCGDVVYAARRTA